MRLFNTVINYAKFIENHWRDSKIVFKIIIFFLAPQIVASIVTGHSLKEVWQNRNSSERNLKEHFFQNLVIWILAIMWFWGFWLIIFPLGVYFAGPWFSKITYFQTV